MIGKKRRGDAAPIIVLVVTVVFVALIIAVMAARGMKNNGNNDVSDDVTESFAVTENTDTDKDDTADTEDVIDTETEDEATESTSPPETEPPAPEQTIPVGIYKKDKKICRRIEEYRSKWPSSSDDPLWDRDTWTYSWTNLICDVEYFAVFTSDEDEIGFTYWDETWTERWEACGLDDTYKIGFRLTAVKKDGETETATVLSPSDTFRLEEYFELYLYDCVAHAHDSWYSHITEKTNYDTTHNVMIKITLREGSLELDHILLEAFVYSSEDEFDVNGDYIGANIASCVVMPE